MGLSILKTISDNMKKIKTKQILLTLAWVLPIAVILGILYYNFLPLGYEKTFTIKVGAEGDDKGTFYLEESPDLGARQSIDDQNFRYLDGLAYAVFKSKEVFKDASLKASLDGQNISFVIPPDTANLEWDYDWNSQNISQSFVLQGPQAEKYSFFTGAKPEIIEESYSTNPKEGVAIEISWYAEIESKLLEGDISLSQNIKEIRLKYQDAEINYPLPDFFIGKNQSALVVLKNKDLYLFINQEQVAKKSFSQNINEIENLSLKKSDNTNELKLYPKIVANLADQFGCVYLDGATRLVLPESKNNFNEGPFAIYAEWIPEKKEDNQQIIGHFNWEIYQNKESLQFRIGRVNDKDGPFYSITYRISDSFFNQRNKLLAIYNPASEENPNGYIELYVNDIFAGREYFANDTIWTEYGQDLSMGWSSHNYRKYPYFKGSICEAKFIYEKLEPRSETSWDISLNGDYIKLPLMGIGKLKEIKLEVRQ
jgi:hypothetical protein